MTTTTTCKAMLLSIATLTASTLVGCNQQQTIGGQEPWSTRSRSVVSNDAALGSNQQDPNTAQAMPVSNTTTHTAEALRNTAVDLLLQASESRNPLLRANAMEALHSTPEHLSPVVRRGLLDQNRGVRFVAAMTVGRQKMIDEAHLLEPLLNDPSQSVQAAALYGMRRCGYKVNLNPLAHMIVSEDPEVRGNAALVLGELGDQTAAPLLRASAGAGMPRVGQIRTRIVDLQLAEAMVKLGDSSQLEIIRAALFTPAEQGEISALACLMCGRLDDERAAAQLYDLAMRQGQQRMPAEIRMAATFGLAQIDPQRAPITVAEQYIHADAFELRSQAALTLGEISGGEALRLVAGMLTDENAVVQVAAAGALLKASRRPMYVEAPGR